MRTNERAALRRSTWVAMGAALATLSGIAVAVAAPVGHKAASTTVTTHQTKQGKVLAAGNGHTLYLFTQDKGTTSTCTGSCAAIWPPLLTTGRPGGAKGSGVNSKLLGTSRRSNGKLQVTYNRHPLYLFASDTKPGQSKGEGVNQFYEVGTKGKAVKPKSPAVCNPLCPGY
jgi:predicted lipoprotein with Yx(FWY)xxD motif